MASKSYNKDRDKGILFIKKADDIDPTDDDLNILRAVASCGHVVSPDSMTGWCRSQLDQGQQVFNCPVKRCGKVWSYEEVRKLALLTPEEMEHFELTLTILACGGSQKRSCPGCGMLIQRQDSSNLNVICKICSLKKGKDFEFCWQCLQEWVGIRPRSDKCDNSGCLNDALKLLQTCLLMPLQWDVANCPSVRACPTCGTLVKHEATQCKNVKCPHCGKEFCFVCLKLTSDCQKLKPGSWYTTCANNVVAPRQTSLPSWNG